MGSMGYSLFWVLQELHRQPYHQVAAASNSGSTAAPQPNAALEEAKSRSLQDAMANNSCTTGKSPAQNCSVATIYIIGAHGMGHGGDSVMALPRSAHISSYYVVCPTSAVGTYVGLRRGFRELSVPLSWTAPRRLD